MELLPCLVKKCNEAISAKGFCKKHYARLIRTGRTTLKTTKERLLEKCVPEPNTGCWLWTEYCNEWGYGRLRVNGKKMLAHRASWETFIGPIPDGLRVCHHCDTESCINPDHLFTGTDKDNVHDCIKKGRFKGGRTAKI